MTMLWLGGAIVGVWAVLFGGAYGLQCRGWSQKVSVLALIAAYVGLCGLTLLWFGPNGTALLGISGMLVPLGAALVLVRWWHPAQ